MVHWSPYSHILEHATHLDITNLAALQEVHLRHVYGPIVVCGWFFGSETQSLDLDVGDLAVQRHIDTQQLMITAALTLARNLMLPVKAILSEATLISARCRTR